MQKIGAYEIIEKIGAGGMSTVYRGRQVSLNRPVAIKILSDGMIERADLLERFDRESMIIASLNHPNIIQVIDRGVTPENLPYFVMAYVEGTDLDQAMKQGLLDTNRKLSVMIQVCKALAYAHRNGIVHRDVKPANILMDGDGHVLVLDFGIAKFFTEDEALQPEATRSNIVMGTLAYMSPEQQISTAKVTAASDIYSVGVILYELFTGTRPLGHFKKPSELNSQVPAALDVLILRCLEPEPEKRFASADEVKDRLLTLLQGGHLRSGQRERASQGLAKATDKFSLLDVIREDESESVLLYQDCVENRLLVIRKRQGTDRGLNQAKLLTSLKHKNIVNIMGASGNKKLFIIVMEYLSGGSLSDRTLQPIPWGEALRIGRSICEGLAFAHRNRIIHGNLRPANILFSGSGQVKVTDFGLDERISGGNGGTNPYNIWGESPSQSADVLAAGVIFYEMLTGTLPEWDGLAFVPGEYFELLPEDLQGLVRRMLASDPLERHTGCERIIQEIDQLLAACADNPELVGATEVINMANLAGDGTRAEVVLRAKALWGKLTMCLGHALKRPEKDAAEEEQEQPEERAA